MNRYSSAFQERLEALHNDNPDFLTPPARRNEMLGRLAEGLNDVPISRTNFTWVGLDTIHSRVSDCLRGLQSTGCHQLVF